MQPKDFIEILKGESWRSSVKGTLIFYQLFHVHDGVNIINWKITTLPSLFSSKELGLFDMLYMLQMTTGNGEQCIKAIVGTWFVVIC